MNTAENRLIPADVNLCHPLAIANAGASCARMFTPPTDPAILAQISRLYPKAASTVFSEPGRVRWPSRAFVPRSLRAVPSATTVPWLHAMLPGGSPTGALPPASGPSSNRSASAPSSSGETGAFSVRLLFSFNPSLGLVFLGPLVPAADNRPALALLTSIQLLFGLSLMTRRVPRLGESRMRQHAASALRFLVGSVAVFLSAFEALRIAIPYDPWADEARAWRRWAVKNGQEPGWWRGAIAFYTPMPLNEWKVKTTTWISNLIHALEADEELSRSVDALEAAGTTGKARESDSDLLTSISLGPRAILRAGESDTYADIHENLYAKNCQRANELLAGDLKLVTELNKAERVDAVLENKGHTHLAEEYTKPNIQLGTHTMESDAEFEMVWANFEPWEELFQETDFDVRMIPRWRCVTGVLEDDSAEAS